MKIINRIKALFNHMDEPVVLDLISAELKDGKAFLHPRDEEDVTYLVKSDDIEILLSKSKSLSSKDIYKFTPKEKKPNTPKASDMGQKDKAGARQKTVTLSGTEAEQIPANEFDRFKKKKFVVSLYSDEYDSVMSSIQMYGYKRADFIMACVNSASKGNMERAHKKIIKTHNEIKQEQKALEANKLIKS